MLTIQLIRAHLFKTFPACPLQAFKVQQALQDQPTTSALKERQETQDIPPLLDLLDLEVRMILCCQAAVSWPGLSTN